MVWANMKFMGCRYPPEVEELVNDLESNAPVSVLAERVAAKERPNKPAPLIENFTIYEPADMNSSNVNAISILNESAQKCKKTISFEELGTVKQNELYCAVLISDKTIATGEGSTKKGAKRNAAEMALTILRSCQPVVKKRSVREQDFDSKPAVSKSELVTKAYENAEKISEDNIGNQMLRRMGWTGIGGVGKDGQGRSDPVMAVGVDGKSGLGNNPTEEAAVNKGTVRDTLVMFMASTKQDITFSTELSKEDRAVIHQLSQQYGLIHKSYGKGESRFIVVSKH